MAVYDMIFKRKSFHLFRNIGEEKLTEEDLRQIRSAYEKIIPLCPDIKTAIRFRPAKEKGLGPSAGYAIEIYSERKENYLMNLGYIGEQLDLWLVSQNIGSLWFGLGKPEEESYQDLPFGIMILIAKVDSPEKFRKDLLRSKRLSAEEIWQGEQIPGVSELALFAPSACNSQPWRVKREGSCLQIYRFRRPGKIGIMPSHMVGFFNRIDMGIYLYFLELCLQHEGYSFSRTLFADDGSDREWTLNAEYRLD